MTKKHKLIDRFTKTPPPTDFTWDELVTLMDRLGFDIHENQGGSSHKHFVYRENISLVVNASKPHPNGNLKHYQIVEIKSKLKEWGLLE